MTRRKKRAIREEEDGYKYPLNPNGHLSHGSAAAQVRQCHLAAVPLFRCGTTAPGKTARIKNEVLAVLAE